MQLLLSAEPHRANDDNNPIRKASRCERGANALMLKKKHLPNFSNRGLAHLRRCSAVAYSGPCGHLIPFEVGTSFCLMWAAIPL
jgi:hypothetical protein